ncbi:MAG: efflux RND transporter periplasmic adaptor subunit [Sphingomonadaceae bacterium]
MNYESSISHQSSDGGYLSDEDVAARRKRRNLIIAGVLVLAAIIAAYMVFGRGGSSAGGAGADSAANKQVPRVTVVVPGQTSVTNVITATGSLGARREMPVGVVGEGGMVSRVWVEPGDWVGQGQVLASIERSVQSQEVSQLAASIAVAQADARLAQSELDRASALVSRGFISKADLDRKTATRDAARARVAVAQAQFGAGKARVGRLDIRAPASGLVLTRAVEPGQVVGAGSGVLFRLARDGEMELKAQLAEGDLARMREGFAAKVTPVGTPIAFTGHIWQLSPVIDPQARQGVARIALAYDKALRPGGFATAEIVSGTLQAPLLPESAVQSDEKGNFVLIVGKGNKVERRDVKVGSVTSTGIPVTSGLSGKERVVLTAGAFLNPGETVIPERAKATK